MEDPKRVRQQLVAAFNARDTSVLEALVHPRFLYSSAMIRSEGTTGPAGLQVQWEKNWRSFSDSVITIEEQIAEGDAVVTRYSRVGTHDGDLLLGGVFIAATGREITTSGIVIEHLLDAKLHRTHECNDVVGQLRQMGVLDEASA
jgi:predicted ester cyclase